MFNNVFFPTNHAVYETMWKNIVEPERPQIIWRMRIVCRIPQATDTHSDCVISFKLRHLRCVYSNEVKDKLMSKHN